MTGPAATTDTTLTWAVKSIPLWYLCVGAFASAFVMRNALLGHLGRAIVDNLGSAVVGVCIMIGMIWAVRKYRTLRSTPLAWAFFAASMIAALVGLGSVDPAFPAKRVHVVEYFLLAWLVFSAFKSTAAPMALRGLIALIITSMLGGLDELLQGALATRTYGLADILTNVCGAFAGVSAVCGMQLLKDRDWGAGTFSFAGAEAPLALAAGYFLSLAALYPFRGLAFPLWVVLPIIGGLALILKSGGEQTLSKTMERFSISVGVISLTALGGLIYVQVMGIRFL